MSLFSSLSPPAAKPDAFSGLAYIQALRAGYTRDAAAEEERATLAQPEPPAYIQLALAAKKLQQQTQPEKLQPPPQSQQPAPRAPSAKLRVPLPSPPPALHSLLQAAGSLNSSSSVGPFSVAQASPSPSSSDAHLRRRSSLSSLSSACASEVAAEGLSGWGEAESDGLGGSTEAEGQLASLLNARRASAGHALAASPTKRTSLRQSSQSSLHSAIASAITSTSSSTTSLPPRTSSMPLGVSLHLAHLQGLAQASPSPPPLQGSQTARGTLKSASRESIVGSQTARGVTEEKRDDLSTRSLYRPRAPATPPTAVAVAASTVLLDSRSPVLPSARIPRAFSSGRTLEDELLELEQERRARARERIARTRGSGDHALPPRPGQEQDEKDDLTSGQTKFPRIAGSTTNGKNDDLTQAIAQAEALSRAQAQARTLQLPYLSASCAAEDSPVSIDVSAHSTMFAEKVASFTHRLTVSLQGNLELARKKVQAAEQARLASTRHQLRALLRFYHANESRLYDVSRSVREARRDGQLASLEHEELTKQQGLIHEDYAAQHAAFHAQIVQLHETGKDRRQHEYLHAHSKMPDAQGSRLTKRGSRGSSQTPTVAGAPVPSPTSASSSSTSNPTATPSTTTSSAEEQNLKPTSAHGHHSRNNSSRIAMSRVSPQRSPPFLDSTPASAITVPPFNLEGLSLLTAASSHACSPIDSSSASSRRTSHRRSRDGSVDMSSAPPAPGTGHSRRASRGSGDESRRSSRDMNETPSSSAPPTASQNQIPQQTIELHAKLELLRTYWQEQFASARAARGVLKSLKSELLEVEKATGTQLELELAKTISLEQQLEQMEANHTEALGQRAAELAELQAEHAQVEAANEALRAEARLLSTAARTAASNEEALWAQISEHSSYRLEVSRANASVAREVERSFSAQVRERFEAAQHAQVVLRQVRTELAQVATCGTCGYTLKSASLTWESGETSCEKCAFQRLFPSNFQSVVRAMHKQFAQANSLATRQKQEQEQAEQQNRLVPPSAAATPKTRSPGASPSASVSHLKSHLSIVQLSASASVESAALGDLGARLLEQLSSSRSPDGDSDDEDTPKSGGGGAAVGERIRRGSLGGLADALTAMNDAAAAKSNAPSSTATPDGTSTGGSLAIFPDASAVAIAKTPTPPHRPRLLQELSEVNSTASRAPVSVTKTPFTLLWMKNHVVDSWVARFGAYQLQLDDLAMHAQRLPELLEQFENALADRQRPPPTGLRRPTKIAPVDRSSSNSPVRTESPVRLATTTGQPHPPVRRGESSRALQAHAHATVRSPRNNKQAARA